MKSTDIWTGILQIKDLASSIVHKFARTVNKSMNSFGKDFKDAVKGVEKFNKTMGKIAAAAGTMAILDRAKNYVVGFVRALDQAIDRGTKLKNLERGFQTLSKGSVDLDLVSASLDGTVSRFDLLEKANEAMYKGIPVTTETMIQLTDVARKSAAVLGQDVTYAYGELIKGLARGSAPILENTGQIIDQTKAYDDYKRMVGATHRELNQSEKQYAIFNAVIAASQKKLSEMNVTLDPVRTGYERLRATIQDLSDAFASLATNERIIDTLESISDALLLINLRMKESSENSKGMFGNISESSNPGIAAFKMMITIMDKYVEHSLKTEKIIQGVMKRNAEAIREMGFDPLVSPNGIPGQAPYNPPSSDPTAGYSAIGALNDSIYNDDKGKPRKNPFDVMSGARSSELYTDLFRNDNFSGSVGTEMFDQIFQKMEEYQGRLQLLQEEKWRYIQSTDNVNMASDQYLQTLEKEIKKTEDLIKTKKALTAAVSEQVEKYLSSISGIVQTYAAQGNHSEKTAKKIAKFQQLLEVGFALAALGKQDYVGAANHFASAIMFGRVSGNSVNKKGASGGANSYSDLKQTSNQSGISINVNNTLDGRGFRSTIYSTTEDALIRSNNRGGALAGIRGRG